MHLTHFHLVLKVLFHNQQPLQLTATQLLLLAVRQLQVWEELGLLTGKVQLKQEILQQLLVKDIL